MAKKLLHCDDQVGERIRQLRVSKRMRMPQLADGICSPAYVSRIELGDRTPSLQLIRAFAERLETTPEYLAYGQGNRGAPNLALSSTQKKLLRAFGAVTDTELEFLQKSLRALRDVTRSKKSVDERDGS